MQLDPGASPRLSQPRDTLMHMDTDTRSRFARYTTQNGECLDWTGPLNGRHPQYSWTEDGVRHRRPARAHALHESGVAVAPRAVIFDTCGNDRCVLAEHLRVGTQADLKRWSREARAAAFWSRVNTTGPHCWIWTGPTSTTGLAYGLTSLDNRPELAHRAAWIFEHGEIPPDMYVCHHCDTPQCVRPDHLFLGTPAQNSADMVAKGRAARNRGTRSPNARATADQVHELRRRYDAGGVSTHELAREFGMSAMPVWRIVTRRSYLDVPES